MKISPLLLTPFVASALVAQFGFYNYNRFSNPGGPRYPRGGTAGTTSVVDRGQGTPPMSVSALEGRPLLTLDPSELLRGQLPPGYQTTTPLGVFHGIPTFPGSAPYPGQTVPGLPVPFDPNLVPTAPPLGAAPVRRPDEWPSWFDEGGELSTAFLPTRAILTRSSDRVWFRAPEERAFVPLAFHDKFRLLRDGSVVEVRHKGELSITFHGGSFMRTIRPIRVEVETLNEEIIACRIEDPHYFWVSVENRPLRFTLENGDVIEASTTQFKMVKEWDGDFHTLTNDGTGMLSIRMPGQTVQIPPAHKIRLSLSPHSRARISAELDVSGDVTPQRDGRVLRAEAGRAGGSIQWNGARFRVAPGTTLRIDPLGGSQFPDQRRKQ